MGAGDAHEQHAAIVGPSPWDGCRFCERCAVEQLACERFAMFVHGEGEPRWRATPMAPNRARFQALFDPGLSSSAALRYSGSSGSTAR